MEVGLLVIHVAIGVSLVAHGTQHLLGWFGGYGLQGTGDWMEGFGLRPGRLFAAVVVGVAVNGAGAWSLDAALGLDVDGLAWGLGALGTALAGAGGTLALRDRRAAAVEEPQAAGAAS